MLLAEQRSMLQDKKRAMARINFHPTFVPWSGTTTYAYAFVTNFPTLKSWRKLCRVFEQEANPVFKAVELKVNSILTQS